MSLRTMFVYYVIAFQALFVTWISADDSMPTPLELSIASNPEELCKYAAQKPPTRVTSSNRTVCFRSLQRDSGRGIQWRAMRLATLMDNGTITMDLRVRRVVILAPEATFTLAGNASVSLLSVHKALGINHNYNGYGLASEKAGNSAITFIGQLNGSVFEGQVTYRNVNRSHTVQCRHNNSLGPDFYRNDACLDCLVATYDAFHVPAFSSFSRYRGLNLSILCRGKGREDGRHDHTQSSLWQEPGNLTRQEDEDTSDFPQTGISDYSKVLSNSHYEDLNDRIGLSTDSRYVYAEPTEGSETPTRNPTEADETTEQLSEARAASSETRERNLHDDGDRRILAGVTAPHAVTSVPNVTIIDFAKSAPNITVQDVAKSVLNVTVPDVAKSAQNVTLPCAAKSASNVTVPGVVISAPTISAAVPELKTSYDKNKAAKKPDHHSNQATTKLQSRPPKVDGISGKKETDSALIQSLHITERRDQRRSQQQPGAVESRSSTEQLDNRQTPQPEPPAETEKIQTPIQSRLHQILKSVPSSRKRRDATFVSDNILNMNSRKISLPSEKFLGPRETKREMYLNTLSSSENKKISSSKSKTNIFSISGSRSHGRSHFLNKKPVKNTNRLPRLKLQSKKPVELSFNLKPTTLNSSRSHGRSHFLNKKPVKNTNRLPRLKLQSKKPVELSFNLKPTTLNSSQSRLTYQHKKSWRSKRTTRFTFLRHEYPSHGSRTRRKHKSSSHLNKRRRIRPAQRTSRRHRRSADSRETVSCSLHLVADHLFFDKIGDRNVANTVNLMLAVVIGADAVFRETDFDGDGVKDNIGFLVSNITIIHNSSAAFYSYSSTNGNSFQYLRSFSTGDFSDVCLGVAFTAIDFERGVVGLAWYASSLQGGAGKGGICGQRVYLRNEEASFSFNTAIVSFRTHGVSVSMEKAILTMAHEFGHCFGASHDDMAGSACNRQYPGGTYLMQKYRPSQYSPNNFRFSPCSLRQMYPVIALKGGCFRRYVGPTCGNVVLEEGEECDCGLSGACQFNDPCCTPGDEPPNSQDRPCTVRRSQGFQCSPVAFPCCTLACKLREVGEKCRDKADCYDQATCDGLGPLCPASPLRPDGTLCAGGARICMAGRCRHSLCVRAGFTDCSCQHPASDQCKLCCQTSPLSPCLPAAAFNITSLGGGVVYLPAGDSCLSNRGQCTPMLTSVINSNDQEGGRQCTSVGSLDSDFSALIGMEAESGVGEERGRSLYTWLYLLLLLPVVPAVLLVARRGVSRLALSIRRWNWQEGPLIATHSPLARRAELPSFRPTGVKLRGSSPVNLKLSDRAGLCFCNPSFVRMEMGCQPCTNLMLVRPALNKPRQAKNGGKMPMAPATEKTMRQIPITTRMASRAGRLYSVYRQSRQKGPPPAATPTHSMLVSWYGPPRASPRFLQLMHEAGRQAWQCRLGARRAEAACDRICYRLQRQAGHVTRPRSAPCVPLSAYGSHNTGTALRPFSKQRVASKLSASCDFPCTPSALHNSSNQRTATASSASLYLSSTAPILPPASYNDSSTRSRYRGLVSAPSSLLRHSTSQRETSGLCSPSASRGTHCMSSDKHLRHQHAAIVSSASSDLRGETAGSLRSSHIAVPGGRGRSRTARSHPHEKSGHGRHS